MGWGGHVKKITQKTIDINSRANQLLHCASCHDSDRCHAPKSKGKVSDPPLVVKDDSHTTVHSCDVILFPGGLLVTAKVLALERDCLVVDLL